MGQKRYIYSLNPLKYRHLLNRKNQSILLRIFLIPTNYISREGGFLDKKQYTKAIQSFTQAIALNPNNAKQYEYRGDAYYYLKPIHEGYSGFYTSN